ncbi:hypothetical protein [Williamsia muralis]|uniref:Uncharacterized protein n=1 Tax=Williamsia marianensis TaxID=85044 RepID=A0A2G3PK26_WILMA|nr:hypothetical protein [Williamsia marianensis]PHV65462.1 hypothetical protein CSW57_16980 [Williamsia marianensis]
MPASRSNRLPATILSISALCLGLLTACSEDSGEAVPATSDSIATQSETGTESKSGTGQCGKDAPAGPVAVPATDIDFESGEAAYTVVLSDGTDKCVVVQSDSGGGEFGTDKEVDVRFGDTSAGFLVTVDGETAGNLPADVPHQVKDAFMGLQVDGAYFADSMHSGCEVTITGFDAEMIAGEFTCEDLALFDGGPFSFGSTETPPPPPTDISLESANGWFVVRA